jgi:hypothetical protein
MRRDCSLLAANVDLTSASTMDNLVKQVLNMRYINLKKLEDVLEEIFPDAPCLIEPKQDDEAIIYVPRELTEAEIARAFYSLND